MDCLFMNLLNVIQCICLPGAVEDVTLVELITKMYTKTLLIFLIVNFVSISNGQKSKIFFRKDYTYMEAFQNFYKIHTVPQTWVDAKRVCAQEGATFWHPDNDSEAQALLSFWNRTKPNIEWVYVALSDLLVEGVFETIDGKSISDVYNNWLPGEPNNSDRNGNPQNCVYIYLKEGPGYLDDYGCDLKYSFICKKSLKSLEWNYKCNMPYLDYTLNHDNNKCYKLHTKPLSWNEANAVCRLEQSSLAVINNQLEADYLVKLTEITPKPTVKGLYQRGIYHLGFLNRFNQGWRTVGGTPVTVDQDVWWDSYQPEGDDAREQCGAMFFNGRLININCNMISSFICEHVLDVVVSPAFTNSGRPLLQPYIGGGIE